MPELTVALFTEVVDTTSQLVDNISADQWSAPTPCTEWDVRTLTDHLLTGQQAFTQILTGRSAAEPAADYRSSAAGLVNAFQQPDALTRIVELPVGAVPGTVALHLQTIEHLVHGWDVATATGQKAVFPDDALEAAIEFSRGLLTQIPTGPDGPFQSSQPAPETAPAIDRLAALLGRKLS
jgi:uncharacterized protein (TIGR03086 family)